MIPKLSAWSLIRNATGADSAPRRSFVLAVLEIYQRYGVYIGGQLAYADLVQQWPAAGFRRNDLETALDDAVAAGLLSFDDRDGEPALVLLSTQWPENSQRPLVQRLRQRAADHTLLLQRAHRRESSSPWNGDNRRAHGAAAIA